MEAGEEKVQATPIEDCRCCQASVKVVLATGWRAPLGSPCMQTTWGPFT